MLPSTDARPVGSPFRRRRGERHTHPRLQHGQPDAAEHGLEPWDGPGSGRAGHHRAHPSHSETQRHRSGLQLSLSLLPPALVLVSQPRNWLMSKTCHVPNSEDEQLRYWVMRGREERGPGIWVIRRQGMRLILATKFVVMKKLFHIGEEDMDKAPSVWTPGCSHIWRQWQQLWGREGRRHQEENQIEIESKKNKNEPCWLVAKERNGVALVTVEISHPPLAQVKGQSREWESRLLASTVVLLFF